MTTNAELLLNDIRNRLELLIYLQLRKNEIESMTTGEQIFLLKQLGMTDNTIASLFGKSKSYISSEIVRQKKRKKQ